jgi:NAD(P)H-hydrate epimerase
LGAGYQIICGLGNNGGDGLALARLLIKQNLPVEVVLVGADIGKASADNAKNYARLKEAGVPISHVKQIGDYALPPEDYVLADALLGAGLNRPLEGLIAQVVEKLNQAPHHKVAIDIPTGLFADENVKNDLKKVFKVQHTFTLQHPKLALLNAFTAPLAGEVEILDIGLSQDFYKTAPCKDFFVEAFEPNAFYRPRTKFSYKNTYGHAYLVAATEGTGGAALLAAKAALRSGCGLLTLNAPSFLERSLNQTLPEAMFISREKSIYWPDFTFNAVAVGPGLGQGKSEKELLKQVIQNAQQPLVLDADALNILAAEKTWLNFLPQQTVLTPHVGEFKRLIGVKSLEENYPEQLRSFAEKHRIYVLLKDTISILASPAGQLFYSDFGSPALATAGSGDTLTGVILGLLAQKYPVYQAVILGVYLHGKAAKMAAKASAEESVLASDIANNLGKAFSALQ